MAKKAPAKPKPNELEQNKAAYSRLSGKLKEASKAPAKRKPRPKKPAELSESDVVKPVDPQKDSNASGFIRSMSVIVPVVIALAIGAIGAGGGIWAAGGIPIGPNKDAKPDVVSSVFDAQEAAFRKHTAEVVEALKSGKIASEKAATDMMADKFLPDVEASWVPLLTAESAAFGGEKWTAEKHAAHIEGYVR